MASPTIESLCCLKTSTGLTAKFSLDFYTFSYNIVSIFSSVFGIGGALFQIFCKENVNLRSGSQSGVSDRHSTRGRTIIKWLAFTDLMAALGLLIRSISWLIDKDFRTAEDDIVGQVFCIVTSGWIHYFYTVTYAWTFLYALDVKLVLQGKKVKIFLYHVLAWSLPAVTCMTGLLFLYLPDLNCRSSFINPYMRFLPNYLSTFLPIVLVMIANPLLYFVSFSSVEKILPMATGRYTERERKIVRNVRVKFLLINLGFYICWLPNIVNGVLLLSSWNGSMNYAFIFIWYLMAILNPLQALLNCFLYRNWNLEPEPSRHSYWIHSTIQDDFSFPQNSSSEDEEEIKTDTLPIKKYTDERTNSSKFSNSLKRTSSLKEFSQSLTLSEKTPLVK